MKFFLKSMTLIVIALLASTANATTPEELSRRYYEYLDTNQWDKLADMLDQSALREFKAKLLPLMRTNDADEENSFLSTIFGDKATYEEASATSDTDFFIAVISKVVGLVRTSGVKEENVKILGTIADDNDVVYVLVRQHYKLGDIDLIYKEVLSFKKSVDDWRLLLSGKILGLVQTLQTASYNSTEP